MRQNQQMTLLSQNIQQLRQFLTEIHHSAQSQHQSIVDNQIKYQEDIQSNHNNPAYVVCQEQLNKIKSTIDNLIEFSFQLLNDVQRKTQNIETTIKKNIELQEQLNKQLRQNQLIVQKLHQIEEDNDRYKQKLEQAQTQISQLSLQKSEIQLVKLNSKDTNNIFYQIQYYNQSRSERLMDKSEDQVQSKFVSLLNKKDDQILYLETQIAKMQKQFIKLEEELQANKVQSKLCQISFKNQINRLNLNLSQTLQKIDCLPQFSNIKKKEFVQRIQIGLSRVNSSQSLYQQSQSKYIQNGYQSSQDYQKSQQGQSYINQDESMMISIIRSNKQKKSLKQDVFDFCTQTFQNIDIKNKQGQTIQIKSIAIQTQPNQVVSKGIQANGNLHFKKQTNKDFMKVKIQKQVQKIEPEKETIVKGKNQKNIFLNIIQFAMKKAVSSRIKCKRNEKKP